MIQALSSGLLFVSLFRRSPSLWRGVYRRSCLSKLGVLFRFMDSLVLKGDGGLELSERSQWCVVAVWSSHPCDFVCILRSRVLCCRLWQRKFILAVALLLLVLLMV